MTPYRTRHGPPPSEPPNADRPTDALDVFFWLVVATLGLATANGTSRANAPRDVELQLGTIKLTEPARR
ncbi:MAG: hypothetical protein M3O46_19500 [Myxococcota bacterium]|nr:hypothetical protein [Myxococcota bacterium]